MDYWLSLLVKVVTCTGAGETRNIWHFSEERRFINLFADKKLHSVIKIECSFLQLQNLSLLGERDWNPNTSSIYLHLFCYSKVKGDWELSQYHAIYISKTCYSLMIFERRLWLLQLFITPHILLFACILKLGRLRWCKQADAYATAAWVQKDTAW